MKEEEREREGRSYVERQKLNDKPERDVKER